MKYNILITSRLLIYACTITLVKYCLSVDHLILIMLWIACVKLVGELSDQNYVKHATSHLTWQIAYVYLINLIYGKVANKS